MALQKQIVGYNFTSGLDTKTDGLLVEPPYLTRLENGVFTRHGSIKKRFGYQSLNRKIFPTDTELTSGRSLATFFDELLLLTDDQLYSRTTNSDSWVPKGAHCHLKVSVKCLVSDENFYYRPTIATCGESSAYGWGRETSVLDGSLATAQDRLTGVSYYTNDLIETTAIDPQAVTIGATMFMLYGLEAPSTLLRFFPIPCAGDAAITGNSTFDLEYTQVAYDVTPSAAFGGSAVVAWTHTDGNVHLAYMTDTGVKGGPGNGFPVEFAVVGGTIDQIHVHTDPNNNNVVLFTRELGVEYRVRVYDQTFTLINSTQVSTDAVDIASGVRPAGVTGPNGEQFLFWGNRVEPFFAPQRDVVRKAVTDSVGIITTAAFDFKVGGVPLANPFVVGTRTIFATQWSSQYDPAYFLIDADTGTMYSRFLYAEADDYKFGYALDPVESSPGVWKLAVKKRGKLLPSPVLQRARFTTDIVEVTFDFTHPRPCMVQVDRNLLMASGLMKAYDGESLTELGFLVQPDGKADVGAPGFLNGNYTYQFVYEWIDNQGQLQRSSPSVDFAVSPAFQSVDLVIYTPGWTDKIPPNRDSARVRVYRTKDNGTIFFELPILIPLSWNTTTGFVTFTDDISDAEIGIQQLIYTTGKVLSNDAPPSATVCLFAKNRVWLADTENGNIWYSKKTVNGQGVAFNLALQIKPMRDITALGALDSKIVAFEKSRIFVMTGDGPNNLGQQDSFTSLQLVNSDVGCVDFRSVIDTSDGIYFKSTKGIYSLTRSLDIKYTGAPVERFNGQTVVDATLVDDRNQIRFLTDAGETLLYDYLFKAWGTFTNFIGVDAVLWGDRYVHLRSDGNAMAETRGQYLDLTRNIPLLLETAWIKSAGVKGWHRIYNIAVLGDFRTVHNLLVRASFDYQPYVDQQLTWDTSKALPQIFYGTIGPYGADPVYGSTNDAVYQFEAKLSRQKCESIKLQFEDTSDTPGEAYILANLTLCMGLKTGTFRLPDAKRLG